MLVFSIFGYNILFLTFHGGGASGPSTVFSTARPCGRAALFLHCVTGCPLHNLTCKQQTMVAQHPHTPLWVRHADVDSTHHTLMGA